MAERQPRLPLLQDIRASAKRLRREGKRLAGRFRHDALRLVERTPAVDSFLAVASARKLRANALKSAQRAVRELEAQRTRLTASLGARLGGLADLIASGLKAAARSEVEDLERRIARVERELHVLKERLGKAA